LTAISSHEALVGRTQGRRYANLVGLKGAAAAGFPGSA